MRACMRDEYCFLIFAQFTEGILSPQHYLWGQLPNTFTVSTQTKTCNNSLLELNFKCVCAHCEKNEPISMVEY